jgi:hypothetical protein
MFEGVPLFFVVLAYIFGGLVGVLLIVMLVMLIILIAKMFLSVIKD